MHFYIATRDSMQLRPYQLDAISCIKSTFKTKERQFIVLPTGAGKTITFLQYAKENHERILIIVPSRQLLNQVYETALLFFEEDEISRKGDRYSENPSKVHICIINSINDKYREFITGQYFDLVVIDEAHHIQAKLYKKCLDKFVFAPKFLGVTATPSRSDGKLLEELLHCCSFQITVEELIEQKYLSDVEGYRVKTNIDISDVDSHNGDFSITELYKRLSCDSRNRLIVDICQKEMKERKTLIFCINVKHAKEISKLLNENGLSCKAIYGEMPSYQKEYILRSFREGNIQFLTNCQILTEGFDEPSISGILLARPTRSRSLFLQMIGRGLRIFTGKENCKIVDIVDSHRSISGFNNILVENKYEEMERFYGIKDLRKHVKNEIEQCIESTIVRTNLFYNNNINQFPLTKSMEEYIQQHGILYAGTLSINEATFLIWYNELKEEHKRWR